METDRPKREREKNREAKSRFSQFHEDYQKICISPHCINMCFFWLSMCFFWLSNKRQLLSYAQLEPIPIHNKNLIFTSRQEINLYETLINTSLSWFKYISRNKDVPPRHTKFIMAHPIAATCFGCTKQPSSDHMHYKILKKYIYTSVATYVVLYLHFLTNTAWWRLLCAAETCSCYWICYNKITVSTDYVLLIACSTSPTGKSHLMIKQSYCFGLHHLVSQNTI